jgi:hypothetical protein
MKLRSWVGFIAWPACIVPTRPTAQCHTRPTAARLHRATAHAQHAHAAHCLTDPRCMRPRHAATRGGVASMALATAGSKQNGGKRRHATVASDDAREAMRPSPALGVGLAARVTQLQVLAATPCARRSRG